MPSRLKTVKKAEHCAILLHSRPEARRHTSGAQSQPYRGVAGADSLAGGVAEGVRYAAGRAVTTPVPDGRVKLGAQLVQLLVEHNFLGQGKWANIILVGTKADRATEEETSSGSIIFTERERGLRWIALVAWWELFACP
jgi:hypothetical protein